MKATKDTATGLVHVEFDWSDEHGVCYDCGLPAAYRFASGLDMKLCSVCAAGYAADGDEITRIEPDD